MWGLLHVSHDQVSLSVNLVIFQITVYFPKTGEIYSNFSFKEETDEIHPSFNDSFYELLKKRKFLRFLLSDYPSSNTYRFLRLAGFEAQRWHRKLPSV